MINILDRYLLTQIVGGVLLTLVVLAGLDGFISFINELDTIGRGNYGFFEAGFYILLTLPKRLYEYAPTAVLIGGLLSLGGLAGHGEVTAIRAAGLSVWGFVRAVLKAGSLFVLGIFLLGEVIAPSSLQQAQQLRTQALSGDVAVNSPKGIWVRYQDLFVQTDALLNSDTLIDLRIFRFDDTRPVEITYAKSAEHNDEGWLLKDVRKVRVENSQVHQELLEQEQWPNIIADNLFDVLSVDPDEMGAKDLYSYVGYLKDNHLESRQYELAFWNRFILPLSSLVMLMLALPFIFGSQRTGGAGQRLFIGVMLGIGYFLASRLLNQLGLVYGLPGFLSAVLPPLLFLGLAYGLLRRI